MSFSRLAFIIVAIPFTLLALLLVFLEMGMGRGSGIGAVGVFVLCGGAYIYGSICALNGQLPLSALVWAGLLLNIVGAFAWMPMFGSKSGGQLFGFIGAGLVALWCKAIYDGYRESRH
ncbi:MAG: hypothetical protein U0984_09460 [Prosthecobacter sp.]|nr:hypothetical protein [Prosthecobacter sp.]